MGVTISQLQPEELLTFKKLSTSVPLDQIAIPERPENRKRTNVKWLIIFGIIILVLLPLMIYTVKQADIKRLTENYDDCHNLCGQKNDYVEGVLCSGKDYTDYPYLQIVRTYLGQSRRCVQSCSSGYVPVNGRCISDDYPEDNSILSNLMGNTWRIIISCLLSILVAIGMVFLLRYATAFVVWGILIGSYLALVAATIYLWVLQITGSAIALTIFLLILGLFFCFFIQKIELMILLVKEATIAIFDMPGLIVIPLVAVIAILIITFLFIFTTVFIVSAAYKQEYNEASQSYVYVNDPVVTFTGIYNFAVFILSAQFFIGLQYIIIAGAVAKWYFARDKNFLERPILTSSTITCRYHLGTVALGSLLITMVQIIRIITYTAFVSMKLRPRWRSTCNSMDRWFKFLSAYAYIVTAIHGQSFFRSGKRSVRLLIQNLGSILAVNFILGFVIAMAGFLIVLVTVLLSVAILKIEPAPGSDDWAPYLIVAAVSCLVSWVSLTVVETSISTIFVCYCEDVLLNNGRTRPYYMSNSLIDFVQRSKAIYVSK